MRCTDCKYAKETIPSQLHYVYCTICCKEMSTTREFEKCQMDENLTDANKQIKKMEERITRLRQEIDELQTIKCHDCNYYRAQSIIDGKPMHYVCCRTNGYSPGENHYCGWGEQSFIPMRFRYTAGCISDTSRKENRP